MTWYEMNMLSKYSMFDVDENENKSNSSNKDPITSNEHDEDEVGHDPFEFSNDDENLFSRFLSNPMV
jgi:hypothetical protein